MATTICLQLSYPRPAVSALPKVAAFQIICFPHEEQHAMPDSKCVLLLIESSRAYSRGCLAGVASYVRAHPNWRVVHLERSLGEGGTSPLRRWGANGVVARVETTQMVRTVSRLKLPTVHLRSVHRPQPGCLLETDHQVCARLAADHFRQHRFRHFAFCGYPGVSFSDQRCASFVEHVSAHGHTVNVFEPLHVAAEGDDLISREARGELPNTQLVQWLRSLTRPVAVFACNDVRGRQLLTACLRAGLSVPDDVAVLGVDNDEVICDLSAPPLSSVEPDTKRIGYEGAALLDRLMAGESPPEEAILIPPKGVHIRQSTDVVALEDRDVVTALRYIRDHACDGITVDDVAQQMAISRATLDRRFQRALERSPKTEIDRIRVNRAKRLLVETDYKIAAIATMTGYGMAPQFVTAFKRLTGFTPGKYREGAIRNTS